jgi:hypothetical protein
MQKRRIVAAAVVAFAAAVLMTSAGVGNAAPSTIDLSSDQAVKTYLTAIGVNPADVVIQRGLKNYAGPFCPGPDWNCTTATQVVQVAQPGGANSFECGDPALLTTNPLAVPAAAYRVPNACFAAQKAPVGTNTIAVSLQKTDENNQTLSCGVPGGVQETEGGQNHFKCHLKIQVKGSQPIQTATEIAAIKQIAVGGGNHSNINLDISLTSNLQKAPAGGQKQDGHQSAVVDQEASEGAFNQAIVNETQFLRATIRGATTSDQFQNTGGLPQNLNDCVPGSIVTEPNSCANIDQQSDGGQQTSQLKLLNDLDARTDATAGSQNQGGPSAETEHNTGLDGTVPQPTNGGTDHSHEDYEERQTVAAGGPGVTANQTGPMSCCALQLGSAPNSTVNADQRSVQRAVLLGPETSPSIDLSALDLTLAMANPNAVQATLLFGKIETNGMGTLTHEFRQDGGSDRRECTAESEGNGTIGALENGTPACALVTAAVNGQPITCGPGEVLVFDDGEFTCQEPFEDF